MPGRSGKRESFFIEIFKTDKRQVMVPDNSWEMPNSSYCLRRPVIFIFLICWRRVFIYGKWR